MILRSTKGFFEAKTFGALFAHQEEFQGALPAIEVGGYVIDVDSASSAEGTAELVIREIEDAIGMLRVDAEAAGDTEQVWLCDAALKGNISALEVCCDVLCDVAAQD